MQPMIRRRFAVTAVGAGVTAIAGCLDDGMSDDDDQETNNEPDRAVEPPFEVTTVDAPGSEAGAVTVPSSNRWLLVNFTATQCPTSEGFLADLNDARTEFQEQYELGPNGNFEMLSVVSGAIGTVPTTDELAAWWRDHDGAWLVGLDEDGGLYDYYDISRTPSLALLDENGEVRWSRDSTVSAGTIVSGVTSAIEDANDTNGSTTSDSDVTITNSGGNANTTDADGG